VLGPFNFYIGQFDPIVFLCVHEEGKNGQKESCLNLIKLKPARNVYFYLFSYIFIQLLVMIVYFSAVQEMCETLRANAKWSTVGSSYFWHCLDRLLLTELVILARLSSHC